jgi:hypothetical protein
MLLNYDIRLNLPKVASTAQPDIRFLIQHCYLFEPRRHKDTVNPVPLCFCGFIVFIHHAALQANAVKEVDA